MTWRFHITPTSESWGNCLEVEADTYTEALDAVGRRMSGMCEVRLVKLIGTMQVKRSRLLSRDHRAVITILPGNEGRKLTRLERVKLIIKTAINIWRQ